MGWDTTGVLLHSISNIWIRVLLTFPFKQSLQNLLLSIPPVSARWTRELHQHGRHHTFHSTDRLHDIPIRLHDLQGIRKDFTHIVWRQRYDSSNGYINALSQNTSASSRAHMSHTHVLYTTSTFFFMYNTFIYWADFADNTPSRVQVLHFILNLHWKENCIDIAWAKSNYTCQITCISFSPDTHGYTNEAIRGPLTLETRTIHNYNYTAIIYTNEVHLAVIYNRTDNTWQWHAANYRHGLQDFSTVHSRALGLTFPKEVIIHQATPGDSHGLNNSYSFFYLFSTSAITLTISGISFTASYSMGRCFSINFFLGWQLAAGLS